MKKQIAIFILCQFMFCSGCAALFNGYKDELILKNSTEQTQVFTLSGVESKEKVRNNVFDKEESNVMTDSDGKENTPTSTRLTFLPINRDCVLTFMDTTKVKKIDVKTAFDLDRFFFDLLFPDSLFSDCFTGDVYVYPEEKN